MIKKIIIPILAILTSIGGYSQELLNNYIQKYPNSNGVFLQNKEDVTIKIGKSGHPEINSRHYEERFFLNDNYKVYMNGAIHFSSFNSITNIIPAVYKPVNDKFKKTIIKRIDEEDSYTNWIFHDDQKVKKFNYTGLAKGGKTTLSYNKKYDEPHLFGSFYFSSYFPVQKASYTITTPASMKITAKLFGQNKDKVKYSVITKGKNKIHTWVATDMPKLPRESGSLSTGYYATHIVVYINSYKNKEGEQNFIRNVDDLHSYYRGFVNDINLDNPGPLENIADSLVQGLTTNKEKVQSILYWVQDNIKYVAFEDGMGGFVPRQASLVCSRRYGDCKDMSSILYKMINHVGIPAYYTWIGSRDIPYTYNEVPTPYADNHMICSYHDGNQYIFLDATGKNLPYGMPTSFIQGKEALISLGKDKFEVVEVPTVKLEKNITSDTVYVTIKKDEMIGQAHVQYEGYPARSIKDYISNLDTKTKEQWYKSAFKKGNNKCQSDVNNIEGLKSRETPLTIDYSFKLPDYIRTKDDDIYFNPFLKKHYSKSKIDTKTEKLDKKNDYKEIDRNVIYYNIPSGYEVDYIPSSFSKESDFFNCSVNIEHDKRNNRIEVQTYFESNHLVLRQKNFEEWNKIIKQLNESYSELIILKKI